ncbi:hypothetical protein AMATHDRAFT_68189 [Amanita thiersii Skay4041]|uniref:Uncharacterized protein n=1 Tax=Amanita thiersii Skay4041 TaxID=703135 RepID=A0A2A9ND37_9AGAR|nr:hypothetical protein AMATHDRAFT_68189 [Amanita thiersii Skay4041]
MNGLRYKGYTKGALKPLVHGKMPFLLQQKRRDEAGLLTHLPGTPEAAVILILG